MSKPIKNLFLQKTEFVMAILYSYVKVKLSLNYYEFRWMGFCGEPPPALLPSKRLSGDRTGLEVQEEFYTYYPLDWCPHPPPHIQL